MSEEPKRKPPNNEKSVKSSPDAEELEEKAPPPIDPWAMLKIVRNPDGSITRQTDLLTVPPTTEEEMSVPGLSVVTKDVTLNAENGTWVRIYRPMKIPSNDTNVARLPVIVYFHCGAFIMFSADNVFDNEPCTRFCSETLSIVVSVNFRLAPENKLPAAYDDGIETLLWLKNQAVNPNGEQWLKDYADFSRCYIMGASTGGTVAYYTALRATTMNLEPVKLYGLILNQPFFTGTKKTKSERKSANDAVIPGPVVDVMVELALPDGSDHDHEYLNPMTKSEYSDNIKKLPRTLVRGFEGDPALDRQMELVRVLIRHGVPVTAHFSEIGFHLIDFIDPKRHLTMLKYLKEFII